MYTTPRNLNLSTNIEEIKCSCKDELNFFNDILSGQVTNYTLTKYSVAAYNFIEKAQLTILLFKGLLAVLDDPEDSKDFYWFGVLVNIKPTDNIEKIIHEHHCHLIDLQNKVEEIKTLSQGFVEKQNALLDLLTSGWINPMTGCRNTYHQNLNSIVSQILKQVTVGVTDISGFVDSAHASGGIDLAYIKKSLVPMVNKNHITQFHINIHHEDPVYDRYLTLKNHVEGTIRYYIERDAIGASKRLYEQTTTLLDSVVVNKLKVLPNEVGSVFRTYLKAHLMLTKNNACVKNFCSHKDILPCYYEIKKYAKLLKLSNDSYLHDPLTVISLIHQKYGRLKVLNGLPCFVK